MKYLEKLPKKEAVTIYKKIESAKENPLHFIEKLSGIELWKLRAGDYRAIIKLDRSKQELFVVDIGHRKDVYQNL